MAEVRRKRFGTQRKGLGRLPIYFASLAHSHNIDEERIIFNRVHDPVRSLSDTVAILTRELLASAWTGVVGQRSDTRYDALSVRLLRNRLDLSRRRWLDENPISCHCVSGPSRPLRRRDSVLLPGRRTRPGPRRLQREQP